MKNIRTMLCGDLVVMLASCSPQMVTTDYYSNSVNGDDASNGVSVGTPSKLLIELQSLALKGGDSVLSKSGAAFTEKLLFSCRGEENNPTVPSKYGGLEKPYIRGNGVDTATTHILNPENLVMRDLKVPNRGDIPKAGLLGLWVELDKLGEPHNMITDDLYVHDIYGGTAIGKGGGIGIYIQNGRDDDSIPSRFIGMAIENCYLKDCQRDGIKSRGYWSREQWNPSLGIAIKKNALDGVPSDGTVLIDCDGGLIKYNVMKNCPKTLPESEACDGIWPWYSDNTLVQLSVVGDYGSTIDGYAYDSDWGC